MPKRLKLLKQSKLCKLDECLSILLDELQLAAVWKRPSILFAVHRSKVDQEQSMSVMEHKLLEYPIDVVKMAPRDSHTNLLNEITQLGQPLNSVFFLQDLDGYFKVYDGLNLYRELIVEHKLKMIFWLDRDEMHQLAHRAPDLWSFRHRVIEFPSNYRSKEKILPSGTLLWPNKSTANSLPDIETEISEQERSSSKLSHDHEHLAIYMNTVVKLLYLYWLVGAGDKITNVVNNNPDLLAMSKIPEKYSFILNAQAINCYDRTEYKEALQSIERAIELNPNQSILWSNYGIICRTVGQRRKSIPSLKKAIRLNPNNPESFGALGYVYLLTGKFASALTFFESAQTLGTDNSQFFPAMAYCYHRLGNLEDFHKMLFLISTAAKDNEYYAICWDALNGEMSLAMNRLNTWILQKKIPRIFVKHDPNLYLFLGNIQFPELLQEIH